MLENIIELIQRWGRFFTIGFAKSDFDSFIFGIIGFIILIIGVIVVYREES